MPVILQLGPQRTHVAVDDVALDHEVRSPEGIEYLHAREDRAGVRGEKVQQCLLERGELQFVLPCEHLTVQNIDLKVTNAQARQ